MTTNETISSTAWRNHETSKLKPLTRGRQQLNRMVASLFCVLGLMSAQCQALDAKTTADMHAALEALGVLLPLSARAASTDAKFDGPTVKKHADALANAANSLIRHATHRELELRQLASSFSRFVEHTRLSLSAGDAAWSYFSLLTLAEHCAACHTRLPTQTTFNLSDSILQDIDAHFLAPVDLANIHIATRQFDKARELLEADLRSFPAPLDELRLTEAFVTYFNLMISVHQDFDAPRALIRDMLARKTFPFYLRSHLATWAQALETLKWQIKNEPSVAAGRAIFAEGTRLALTPNGRERMIHDLVAASILRRALAQSNSLPTSVQAEAYLLLGLIALRTTELRPAIPQMELLLESAIRTAPNSEFARNAYRILEEFGVASVIDAADVGGEPALLKLSELRRLLGID